MQARALHAWLASTFSTCDTGPAWQQDTS